MYKLLTHTDLDGAGCAVFAKMAYGEYIDIEYCVSPEAIADKLKAMYDNRSIFSYHKVFVTDCSIPDSRKDLFALINKHNNVSLFDHHVTAKGLNKYPWAHVENAIDGKLTCGTQLWHNFLVDKGLIQPREFFVEMVRLYDTWDWSKGYSKLPKNLSDLVYILGLSTFVETFVDRMKKNDLNELNLFSQQEREALMHEEKIINNFVKDKIQSSEVITVDGKKIVISFADRYQSVLGHALCKKYDDCNMAMMFDLDDGLVSIRSNNVDSIPYAKAFNGGGHKEASGGKIDEETYKQIVRLLFKNIGNVEF